MGGEQKGGRCPQKVDGRGSERGQDDIQERMWRLRKEAEVQRGVGELKRGWRLRRQEP